MLHLALAFLLVAIVAGIFGFGGIVAAAAGIAQVVFFSFLMLTVVSLVAHAARRGASPGV